LNCLALSINHEAEEFNLPGYHRERLLSPLSDQGSGVDLAPAEFDRGLGLRFLFYARVHPPEGRPDPGQEFIETVIEDWLDDDPFPDCDEEPVTMAS